MFKIKFLRNILLTSLAVVIIFPLYNYFIAYPAFIDALSDEAEDVSVRISTHLSSTLKLKEKELGNVQLVINSDEVETVKKDLNIIKIKVYSSSGHAVYSTDPDDMHGISNRKEFNEIIAEGNVYTKIKEKGAHSLEGESIGTSHIIETYVPIMKADKFLGVIEIYYNISAAKARFEKIRLQSIVLVIIMASGLLSLVFAASLKAGNIITERNQIAKERETLILELRKALEKVKTLRGLLPICSSCNKIRDKKGSWSNVDVYISSHSEAEFTHGYCPECEKIHFPQKDKEGNSKS